MSMDGPKFNVTAVTKERQLKTIVQTKDTARSGCLPANIRKPRRTKADLSFTSDLQPHS